MITGPWLSCLQDPNGTPFAVQFFGCIGLLCRFLSKLCKAANDPCAQMLYTPLLVAVSSPGLYASFQLKFENPLTDNLVPDLWTEISIAETSVEIAALWDCHGWLAGTCFLSVDDDDLHTLKTKEERVMQIKMNLICLTFRIRQV